MRSKRYPGSAVSRPADDEIERLRRQLREQPDCRFVSPPKFFRLLVSRSRLERSIDHMANVVGLSDCETGMRYFVESEKLCADR